MRPFSLLHLGKYFFINHRLKQIIDIKNRSFNTKQKNSVYMKSDIKR